MTLYVGQRIANCESDSSALAGHDLNDAVVIKVSMDPGFTLTAEDFEEVSSEEMKSEYRSLIGSIGYCSVTMRFDIAYAVSVLSRHLAKPCKKVVLAAKRVIKY